MCFLTKRIPTNISIPTNFQSVPVYIRYKILCVILWKEFLPTFNLYHRIWDIKPCVFSLEKNSYQISVCTSLYEIKNPVCFLRKIISTNFSIPTNFQSIPACMRRKIPCVFLGKEFLPTFPFLPTFSLYQFIWDIKSCVFSLEIKFLPLFEFLPLFSKKFGWEGGFH